MAEGPSRQTVLRVRQAGALVVGGILCSCIFIPLSGLIVGVLCADRETRTAMLVSLVVIALYAFEIGPTPYLAGELNRWSVYWLFGQVVCAVCLVALAILGAWLIARKRRRSGPSWEGVVGAIPDGDDEFAQEPQN